jgi:2-polyprenyl-3-methyl-5-hydroxy-6-metoxy-1,4-benzoquinol methylase
VEGLQTTKSKIIQNFPAPFNFYRSFLHSDHLHFGIWPQDKQDLTIEEAQQLMFETVAKFFPKPPARILDVGCGLGLSSALMAKRGYDVAAISPSKEMIEYARKTYADSGARFMQLDFYDEDSQVFQDEKYDIILFQESSQYLGEPTRFIKKARNLLRDRGLLIISDEVSYDRSIKKETAVHMVTEIITALAENGFCITENQKIGERVMKTCDVAIQGLEAIFCSQTGDFKGDNLLIFLEGWKREKGWYSTGQMGYEIFVAKKDFFFIRQYAPPDEIQILEMFKEVFSVDRSLSHWIWKFAKNPYGTFGISEAFSDTGRLVVHYGGHYVPFYNATGVGPQAFISYQGTDTMTRPEVRNIGMGKTNLLSRTAHHCFSKFLEGRVPFAYGFNTGKIKILGKRYLGYNYFDEVVFRVRDFVNNPFRKPYGLRLFRRYRVNEIHSCTSEWDDFFGRVRHSYKLLVKRDSEYLKWRYLDCPDKDYKIYSVHRGKKLVGWSVFLRMDKSLVWGDALFDNRFPESVIHLLHFVQESFIGTDCKRIEGWFSRNPQWWNDILDRLGFAVKEEPNRLSFCYKIFAMPDMSKVLSQFLYYSSGDSDLF